jgi:NTP pyrophosphatase (non-canonical NTP hydrolase)
MGKTITEWIDFCHSSAKNKGFWEKERNVGEMLMLVVSELGEAIEAHRTGLAGLEAKDTFEDELADTAIRLFDMCGGLGIDLEKQIEWKMGFNQSREAKHGKNY